MTNDASILSNICPYTGSTCVAVDNGDILDILIYDSSISLLSGFSLPIKDVLLVLAIQKNLLSTNQLTT